MIPTASPVEPIVHASSGSTREDDRGGFAFAFVVLVLFVIGVLGSAGYTVVKNEADLALGTDDAMEASAVARAGLARYFGEHLGIPDDTASYAIGSGTAEVSARFIAEFDPTNEIDLYLVTSVGSVADGRFENTPATRTIRQYAYLQREPIARQAVMQTSYSNVTIQYYYFIDGDDYSGGTCAESGENVYGVGHRGSFSTGYFSYGGSSVDGSPSASAKLYNTWQEAYDSVGLRWDVLTDPDFPIEYDQTFPNFYTLPADEYPVIRTTTNFTATSSHSGRGVLIVPGTLTIGSSFSWDGIILAGSVGDTSWKVWSVYGMMIVGMNNADATLTWSGIPILYYDVCSAISASNSLAWFEPIEGSAWEEG